jgi:hypothetical protein
VRAGHLGSPSVVNCVPTVRAPVAAVVRMGGERR